jgi:hypothetical protein
VHPPNNSPLADVSRDCGFSVELRDGKALWIFCDTTDFAPGVDGTYFINNSAAIALPGSPTTMREPVAPNGQPYAFIPPTAHNPCGPDPHIIWPTAATVVPAGSRDRVIIYYENACLVGPNNITGIRSRSMGVAELLYNPNVDPLGQPIRATVTNPSLWSDPQQYGRAAVARDGYVYVYQCDHVWGAPSWGCRVGRVAANGYMDPGLYTYWNGSGWYSGKHNANYMRMNDFDTPGVAYQVAWVEDLGLYVMTYVAWPGIGSEQKVRVAASPEGPWSPTISVSIPACGGPNWCYAGGIHPQLGDATRLGLSYHDPLVPFANRPANGQVQAYTLPVAIDQAIPHRFTDVWPEDTFFAEVEWMAAQEISTGWPDGTFRPLDDVSRQAFAAFLHRAAGAPAGPFPDPGFTDVNPVTEPFYLEISWMASVGLAEGFPDGSFGSLEPLSRQAMAAFLYRAAGEPAGSFPDPGFTDVDATHPFFHEISWMATTGITTGFSDGTFRSDVTVSRQATAAFLHRFAACCQVVG